MRCRSLSGPAFLTLLLAAGAAVGAEGPKALALLPARSTLSGPAARQLLVVETTSAGKFGGQITDGVEVTSSNPDVVRVERQGERFYALPVGNGAAQLTARAGAVAATAEVTVAGAADAATWSFRNHVLSVLAKAGCNSGACHGALAGKNGFRLSLRGYDAEGDYQTLTRHALGRRIVPSDPGRSLMLLKPTGALPHKGGARFTTDSLEYRVLSDWIAAGTPPPRPEDRRIDHLEVLPGQIILAAGDRAQLIVRAHFSDGHLEDVTHWVKYTATNASVAEVDDQGAVKVTGHGEGAVTAWYLSKIVVATVTVPYPNQVAPEVFAQAPRQNLIDDLALEKLASLNLPPSPRSTDAEFLRRVYLDTIGVLPAAEETRAFLEDRGADKRQRLIEHLLERPEFIDYWSYKWSDLLLVRGGKLKPQAMWSYYTWIRNQVAANTGWDKLVRSLLTATGSTLENGAANFFVLHEDPFVMAETSSIAFLGMSVGCARCHNHPMEKWTNDQYYGYANLFARVRRKDGDGDGKTIFAAVAGDVIQPVRGRPQPPRPLDGEALPIDSPEDRRVRLADWVTSPENPYFARAITNRVWANFMGVGLVEKVDDLRLTNPASNEKLLSAAAGYLVEKGFDLRALMRAILQSEAYQRSSQPLAENDEDRRFYSHFYPRRLMAEVLLDAVSQVTGVPTEFPCYPAGWRALQLADSNVASYFLTSFGRPKREITCECERSAEPSMSQILHLANGDTINKKLASKGNRIDRLVETGASDAQLIDDLYLSSFCRYPMPEERERLLGVLAGASGDARRQAIEDLYWSVLVSKEFLFNR